MAKDKADRIKEIVEQMQKKTPQKSKNPSLVQKEIKKELKKEDVSEKKEEKKEEKKDKVAEIVKKVKAAISKKSSAGHGKDYDEKELKDVLDFFDDLLTGEEDLEYTKEDKGSLMDAQKVLKNILQNS